MESRRSRSASVDSLGRHKRKREPKRSGGDRHRSRSHSPSRSLSRSRSRSRSPSRRSRHQRVGGGASSSRHGRDRRRSSRDRQSRSRSRERGGSTRDRERTRSRRSPSRSPSPSRSRRENGDQRAGKSELTAGDKDKSSHAGAEKDPETAAANGSASNAMASSALSHLTEEEQMQALMGFGGFETTKGRPVDDNVQGAATGGIRKENKREYRQYMNRRGGFNRPLDNAK